MAAEALKEIALRREDKLTPSESKRRNLLADGETATGQNHKILGNALRFVRKGRETFIGNVQRAARNGDSDALAWWRVFSDLNEAQQARIDLDAVCEVAQVAPDRMMAVVVSAAMRVGSDVADLVEASMRPALVARTVKSAMRIGGEHADIAQKDREFLFQHSRFIPIPKGTNVHVHASAQAAAAAANVPSVPSFADSIDGEPRQVGSGTTVETPEP